MTHTAGVSVPVLGAMLLDWLTANPALAAAGEVSLPVTGVSSEQMQSFGFAGLALVLAGIAMLGGAAAIGQYRKEH